MSKPKIEILNSNDEISQYCANIIQEDLKNNPKMVFGLATGSTPIGLYKELISRHKENKLDFKESSSFNLDEVINLNFS